jgi:membrane protease YdiL (CAAX protease family)
MESMTARERDFAADAEASAERPVPLLGSRSRPVSSAVSDPVSAAVALLPIALLAWVILFPPLRPFALGVVIGGTALLRWRDSPLMWAWAATIPLATIQAWSLLPAPVVAAALASCASLLSPPTVWRVAELGVVLGVVVLVARWLRVPAPVLPFGTQPRWFVGLSVGSAFVIAPVALLVGEQAARPFFGPVHLETGLVGAVLPAIAFGLANATLEETVYRGALLTWAEPVLGSAAAIVAQAAMFGLAHTGPDFVGSPLPVLAAMFALAIVGGVVVKRTGSLAVPIIIHAAFDIPLYYSLACRVA